jgi:hypothetical protein
VKKLEPLLVGEEEKKAYSDALAVRKTYLASRDQVNQLKAEGKTQEADEILTTVYLPAAEAYQGIVSNFLAVQPRQPAWRVRSARSSSGWSRRCRCGPACTSGQTGAPRPRHQARRR